MYSAIAFDSSCLFPPVGRFVGNYISVGVGETTRVFIQVNDIKTTRGKIKNNWMDLIKTRNN